MIDKKVLKIVSIIIDVLLLVSIRHLLSCLLSKNLINGFIITLLGPAIISLFISVYETLKNRGKEKYSLSYILKFNNIFTIVSIFIFSFNMFYFALVVKSSILDYTTLSEVSSRVISYRQVDNCMNEHLIYFVKSIQVANAIFVVVITSAIAKIVDNKKEDYKEELTLEKLGKGNDNYKFSLSSNTSFGFLYKALP